VILPQDVLEGLLRDRLQALGCDVEWNLALTGAETDGNAVSATVTSVVGSTETFEVAYVVGCDGVRSAVRELAGIPWRDHAPYEQTFQLGDIEVDTTLDRATIHQFLGRRGIAVVIPMPGGLMRLVGYVDGEQPDDAPGREQMQRLLDQVGHSGTTVRDVRWSGTFRVVRRLADDFRAGRLFVAGDAAHVHSPAGGQGLNTGLQDATNLAWKLALVLRGAAEETLLDTYTAERRPVAEQILAKTTMQDTRLFGARSLPARKFRNALLRLANRTGAIERKIIPDLAQVRVRYADSPLSVNGGGSRRGPYAAGHQAPDVTFLAAGGTEPIALRRTGPGAVITLVAVPGRRDEGSLSALKALVAEYPGTLRLHEAVAPLPGDDPAASGSLTSVRPDGFIGYRGPCAVTPALRAWLDATLAAPAGDARRPADLTSLRAA
jgi:2-polyprenyl-6-methoxyphenol hydroxylase-like FAD-dependent oxidoreductase